MSKRLDLDALAAELVGDADDLIRAVLRKQAKGIVGGLRELYDQLCDERMQRHDAENVSLTMAENLRHGVPRAEILEWYDNRKGRES